jgi:uncharacterized protein with NRDE domain
MCILFIAVNQHPRYPLVIAANRDEFHQRPTQPAHFWESDKNILAGKDLTAGGTWMGINTAGNIAALTNIRAPGKERQNAITRGELVANFINKHNSQSNYLQQLKDSHLQYNGYNLLFGNLDQLQVYNSFEDTAYELEDGVYGLSNASLNSPWPKLDIGRSALANYCTNADILSHEHLFELLGNNLPANDDELPDTGIPVEWEKKLSSIFIISPEYGTRSSTVLLVDNNHQAYWEERSFSNTGELTNTVVHKFKINKP